MSQLDPYLTFDGNCAEAMRFYERVLGGKIGMMMKNSESPMAEQGSPSDGERIMHARVEIDGRLLMASDAMAGQPYTPMSGFSLTLVYPTTDKARRVFDALAEGGTVRMPLQKTFWVESFGMVVDRFGTPWMVNGGAATM